MSNIINRINRNTVMNFYTKEQSLHVLKRLGIACGKKDDPFSVIVDNWDYDKFRIVTREIALSPIGKYDVTGFPKLLDNRSTTFDEYSQEYGPKPEWVFGNNWDTHSKNQYRDNTPKDAFLSTVWKNQLASNLARDTSKVMELFLVMNNEDIFPTLKNSGGVDFYYKGDPWDWKGSKSIGKKFINDQKKLGMDPIDVAISNPELVARSLYENQSEDRFGYEPRHFIITLNEGFITNEELLKSLSNISFDKPIDLTFNRKKTGESYTTTCLVSYI
jgi:hypothetical protein